VTLFSQFPLRFEIAGFEACGFECYLECS